MDEHYTERISLDDSSSKVGMSKSHFKRFVRRVTGQTFITHLSWFRIAKAQALLASTDRSIAEISQEVGFCSQSYFGVVFQKFAHMSPHPIPKTSTKVARKRPPRPCSGDVFGGANRVTPGGFRGYGHDPHPQERGQLKVEFAGGRTLMQGVQASPVVCENCRRPASSQCAILA
jgi:AraC-like DNA-binding protein